MDLTSLDRADLARLQRGLTVIATAAEVLAEGGIEPEISLTDAAVVLRGSGLLARGEDPGPLLIETCDSDPVAVTPEPDFPAPVPPSSSGGAGEAAEGRAAAGGGRGAQETPAATDPAPATPARGVARVGIPSWSPDDDERLVQLIVEGMARGLSMRAAAGAASDAMQRSEASTRTRAYTPHVQAALKVALQQTTVAASPSVTAAAWTTDEDEILLYQVASLVRQGSSLNKACAVVSKQIGRGIPACLFRLRNALRERFKAALADGNSVANPGEDTIPAGPPAAAAATADREGPDAALGKAASPAPVAGGADTPILGGDAGGLQRDALAEKARPQAATDKGNPTPKPVAAKARPFAAVPPLPTVAAPVQPSDGAPADLHGLDLTIWRHLRELGFPPGWDIEMDVDMVEAFARGSKAAHVALDLDVDAKDVIARYKALTAPIRDDRDRLTIDGQTRFIAVLRRRLIESRCGEPGQRVA